MEDFKIILDVLQEIKKDIEKLYDALESKQKDIESLKTSVSLIEERGTNCREKQKLAIDDVWRAVADIRKDIDGIKLKPDKDRGALAQWVGMFASATGWLVLLLKTFGILP